MRNEESEGELLAPFSIQSDDALGDAGDVNNNNANNANSAKLLIQK